MILAREQVEELINRPRGASLALPIDDWRDAVVLGRTTLHLYAENERLRAERDEARRKLAESCPQAGA